MSYYAFVKPLWVGALIVFVTWLFQLSIKWFKHRRQYKDVVSAMNYYSFTISPKSPLPPKLELRVLYSSLTAASHALLTASSGAI
jgi:hypothetical protein